jgi:hypothetical protein
MQVGQHVFELSLTDSLVPLGEAFPLRVRPPRLLIFVKGVTPGKAPQAGVLGVTLGVSIEERGLNTGPRPAGVIPSDYGVYRTRTPAATYLVTEVCVSGVAPPIVWRDLGHEEVNRIALSLTALGLPAVQPDVQPVPALSGDLIRETTVMGLIDGHVFCVHVGGIYWGYQGRDAPAFIRLLRELFRVAGIDANAGRWREFFEAEP